MWIQEHSAADAAKPIIGPDARATLCIALSAAENARHRGIFP